MKKITLTSAVVLFIGMATFGIDGTYREKWYGSEYSGDSLYTGNFSGNLYFEIHGRYNRAVKKEKLSQANLLSDFISGYPANWVNDYISVEIMGTCNGKSLKGVSQNDVLSTEQKNILNSVDLGTTIEVNVKYKSKNSVTDKAVNNNVYVSMMIIPEVEAEYAGGQQQLKKYLKENAINKISETTPEKFRSGIVTFVVNEKGEIVNAKISKSSGDSKTDKLLLEVINKMPNWKPAENSDGIKVKQEFELSVGNGGC